VKADIGEVNERGGSVVVVVLCKVQLGCVGYDFLGQLEEEREKGFFVMNSGTFRRPIEACGRCVKLLGYGGSDLQDVRCRIAIMRDCV